MSHSDLYIIAAGNGSRLRAGVPKALMPIAGEPCLTRTLTRIGKRFRRVFVVTNESVRDQWRDYFHELNEKAPEVARLVENLPIQSGLGDGHATLQGLLAAERLEVSSVSRDIVVAWGDVVFPDARLIDELLAMTLIGAGLLPAVEEKDPYVTLLVDEKMRCAGADFSKYGERHATGLHDQSVFRFDLRAIRTALEHLHRSLWKHGRYISNNGECSLLYCFHWLYNSGNPAHAYVTKYPTLSFNTIEQLTSIQQQIVLGSASADR